ncbi:hypothetical protein [Quadrisphaera setariae]|uniref:Uncharacterized protein n=1 Tax=Quadrisphaera setariae TaxID=2593304 RepID=A0A5C8ZIP0_9ACTN|nr:hypothetical protein [Quadrisphaera setariae]TXR57737.1 hypothetical protein FMM08_00215 [Quadrisphaera setariae]
MSTHDDDGGTGQVQPSANPETLSAIADRSNGTARATGASVPPPVMDQRGEGSADGTAAGDPLAGVTISAEDAEQAVPGDTGPEHPGARPHSSYDTPGGAR